MLYVRSILVPPTIRENDEVDKNKKPFIGFPTKGSGSRESNHNNYIMDSHLRENTIAGLRYSNNRCRALNVRLKEIGRAHV
jgi:hypothetical protein